MTLTSQQLANAQAILNDTSLSKSDRTEQFYIYINGLGDTYSRLALEITTNDNTSWQGQLATGFANANDKGIDVSYGSPYWIDLNHNLAQRHLESYINNSGTPPTQSQIQEYHGEEYENIGLDADDWFPNRFLNDSANPDALWDDWQYNTSELDIIQDAFAIATDMAGAVTPMLRLENYTDPLAHQQALLDIQNSKAFTKQFFTAFSQLEGQAVVQLVDDGFIFDDVAQFVSDVWDVAVAANNWFDGVLSDLGDYIDDWLAGVPDILPPGKNPLSPVMDDLGGWWDAAKDAIPLPIFYDPLTLDLDGDGIELVNFTDLGSVYWNADADNFASRSGWITGGDGFLAIDLDANGTIDGQHELFGDATTDGFTALAAYDSNSDGVINVSDAQFGDLLVWVDANSNAISEAGELFTLNALGITEISLTATAVSQTIAGNAITHEGSFTMGGQTYTAANVNLATDHIDTVYAADYTLDVRTLFMPTLRGYGKVADLHIAMSNDETLLNMVADIASADTTTLFSSAFDVKGKVTDILYRWAGVETVAVDSRGTEIDARKLEFLEEYFGEEWQHNSGATNPDVHAAEDLEFVFSRALQTITNDILVQTAAQSFYGTDAYYDLNAGAISNSSFTSLIVVDGPSEAIEPSSVNDIYVVSAESGTASILEGGGANDSLWFAGVTASDLRFTRDGYDLLIHHPNGVITITNQYKQNITRDYNNYEGYKIETLKLEDGTEIDLLSSMIFEGTEGGEVLSGINGEDVLYGHGGDDTLYGEFGADTLIGGAGDDHLSGYDGNDLYIWNIGDGNDQITEGSFDSAGEIDTLKLQGVSESQIRYEYFMPNAYNHALLVHIGSETIQINNHFDKYQGVQSVNPYDAALNMVEFIELDDGTTIDLTGQYTFSGTAAGETIHGLSSRADSLVGHAGDDSLYAYGGADTLEGGTGNDYLTGGTGNDTYVWSVGDGNDTIIEDTGGDTLLLHGVTESQITIQNALNGNDLEIVIGTEKITVVDHARTDAAYDKRELETIKLDDGTVISLLPPAQPPGSNLFTGTSGNDDLRATANKDVLIGHEGNDILRGGQESDIYHWTVGDGNDWVYEWYGVDDALYLHGVYADGLIFNTSADHHDLIIQIGSESISVLDHTRSSWANTTSYDKRQLEKIVFDDGSELSLLGTLTSYGTSSAETIYGRRESDIFFGNEGNDTLLGYYGEDTLTGGAGDDLLKGGSENDTYHWAVGDGNDTIAEWYGDDVLKLHGISANEVTFARDGSGHDLKINIGSEQITVTGQYEANVTNNTSVAWKELESVELDDGTVIDLLNNMTFTGTAAGDQLYGTNANETTHGLDGDDWLYGLSGDDNLYGGSGGDQIRGGNGNDKLYGGAGNDALYGQNGADDFIFEAIHAFNGSDTLYDFNAAQGDRLDVSDLLQGYDPITDAITDFIEITTSGADSIVSVDVDGGADNFVQIATIKSNTGLTDEDQLVSDGNLLVA